MRVWGLATGSSVRVEGETMWCGDWVEFSSTQPPGFRVKTLGLRGQALRLGVSGSVRFEFDGPVIMSRKPKKPQLPNPEAQTLEPNEHTLTHKNRVVETWGVTFGNQDWDPY